MIDFEDLADAYWRATLDAYDAGRQHVAARAAAQVAYWRVEQHVATLADTDEPRTPSSSDDAEAADTTMLWDALTFVAGYLSTHDDDGPRDALSERFPDLDPDELRRFAERVHAYLASS